MKKHTVLAIIFILLSITSKANSENKFDPKLAKDLIRLSASFTFDNIYNLQRDIVPKGYELYYESDVLGMDNKYRIFLKDEKAFIALRGSTSEAISWLQNIHAAMVPAKGIINTDHGSFVYNFAENSEAAVHGGFALGLSYISESLNLKIDELKNLGINDFIFTGHSQGGALVKLLLSDLDLNNTYDEVSFSTYSFGAPMIGNKAYSLEFYDKFIATGKCFIINNEKDIIPNLPISFNTVPDVVNKNVKQYTNNTGRPKFTSITKDLSYIFFGEFIIYFIHQAGKSTIGRISKELGGIQMPQYRGDINYAAIEGQVNLPPVSYPVIIDKHIVIDNNGYKSSYNKIDFDEEVVKKINKSKSRAYQHKSYNYYLSILITFFPESYEKLEDKFLPEML